jgi:arginase
MAFLSGSAANQGGRSVNIDIIGVPVDLGSNRRGVDMGPSTIRYTGLIQAIKKLDRNCRDLEISQFPYLKAIALSKSSQIVQGSSKK